MKITKLLSLVFALGMCASLSAQNLSLPAEKADWFREAKFGMFIHFGLYSQLEGSYEDRSLPDRSLPNGNSWYAEWIQMRLEVPAKEYRKLAKEFNPKNFDAEAWILEAKNAGMKYFVITSKHHDGFALWDSKVSDFDITNTPYKKDMLAQLVAACKKHGMKYGFYYSHWQDWEASGGAWPSWYPMVDDAKFEEYWQKKSLPQVRELITMFDPDLLWFDTWHDPTHITDARRDEMIALVRSLSDKCLINGRISFHSPGENIDFLEMNDNQYPDKILEKPWQTPATMVHSWGWHKGDHSWKSAAQMIGYLAGNVSKGGNYLLNIGPKPDGTFPAPAIRRLREIGAWMHVNGEAIYGAEPVKDIAPEKGLYFTQKDGAVYVFMTRYMPEVALPFTPKECTVLESGMQLKFTDGKIEIPKSFEADAAVKVLKVVR